MTPHPTVVLVDGNPFQRGQNGAALHRAGYDTIALATPSQALSLCDRKAVPIDAFVVTSSHGQVRGLDLVRDMRARRGPVPALLVWEDREPPPTDLHEVAVLVRPYANGFLTAELARLLASSRVRELHGRADERATVDAGERVTPSLLDVVGTGTAAGC
jgi:DNA-binding response OmpR family regulator